jgi:acyl dehydratase
MSRAETGEGWENLAEGTELPEIALEVTEQTVILVPVATWDLFPGHHSPSYARGQGQPDMYLNTIALQGVADRSVTDHLGAAAWVTRRKLAMIDSVYPGDRLAGRARVLAVRRDATGGTPGPEADFSLEMSTRRGPALRAELTVRRYTIPNPAGPVAGLTKEQS